MIKEYIILTRIDIQEELNQDKHDEMKIMTMLEHNINDICGCQIDEVWNNDMHIYAMLTQVDIKEES
jgi:hypothetical protein